MALFQSYAPPGVYTEVIIAATGAPLFGNARIPVIIGEGVTFFTFANQELIRGSSAVADNQVVDEDLSDQVTGLTDTFQVTYFPVTDGTGKGVVTNDPSKIHVTSEGIPLVVISLDGATGQFITQEIVPQGNNLQVSYYFKRTDTLIKNENLAAQIPTFAALVYGTTPNQLTFSLSMPGDLGNLVHLAFTQTPASGKSDALAVSGVGTAAISIELVKSITYALTQVANHSGANTTYTGTFTTPYPATGSKISILGFTASADNGVFVVVSCNATTLVVANNAGVAEGPEAGPTANPIRSLSDIVTLVTAGIPTAYGNLTATLSGSGTTPGSILSTTPFAGGSGPQTNTVFKTHFTPIVDGTNGGVVTTNPANVTVLVNGIAAAVTALNGQFGLVTLQNPVLDGSTLTITYYINQYQYTSDILPAPQVASIIQVGLGPNRSDFIQGVDFELNQAGTLICWGANADTAVGLTNPNSPATFGPADITTTLVDEQVWLRPVTGSVNGVNAQFILEDTPVDGSGLNRPTDNPSLVSVYIGTDPITALLAGAVSVSRLSGDTATVTLFDPPTTGNVYASYWRSQLDDHTFTLTVQNPGIPGQGTYSIVNELGQVVPSTVVGPATIFQHGAFAALGIVWPNQFPDLNAEPGDATEIVTITFQDDDLSKILTPAVQATDLVTFSSGHSITFSATEIGVLEPDFTAPNSTTSLKFVDNSSEPISSDGTFHSSPVYNSLQFFNGATGLLFTAPAAQWQATTAYAVGDAIYDPITSSIQVVTTAGTSDILANMPTFSATAGTHSTPSPDGSTLVWTSAGIVPVSAEIIFVNIVNPATATYTLTGIANLFSGSNKVFTPLAGQITAVTTVPADATAATAQAVSEFAGGVNPVTIDYSNRFLVTSSIAGGKGTGQETTPASANVDAHSAWSASTVFNAGQIVHFTVSGNNYIAQVQQEGLSGTGTPSWNTTTGGSTTESGGDSLVWITLGPQITPVGANGYLGQTYIDLKTGVKFTVVDPAEALNYGYQSLPSPQYQFMPGDVLTFSISANETTAGPTFQPFVTGSEPIINIGGLWVKVTTTYGSTAGDTATINTFKGEANEPNVGEYYYITYTVNKTAADMALKIYTNPTDAYAAYGQPTVVNRLSLAVQLLTGNGAQQFGCVQVPQQPNMNVASDESYESAIQSLAVNLPGTNRKVNVIVPLSTSAPVQQYLSRFLITQAAPRQKGEAIGFVGMPLYSTASDASALANALHNSRVILIAPFAFGIQITNPTTGVAIEYAVSGEFAAAAMAGLNVNPANDVATSLTNQNIVGFSRILLRLDDPTMDLMAANGVCLLIEDDGALNVRHYKSTDPSNIITSEPTCTTITDYVSQAFRNDLQQFIGRKLVGSLLGSIQLVCNSRLQSLVAAQIINGYSSPVVIQDPSDPTTVDIAVTFQPIFTLLYIGVTFTVTSSSVSSQGVNQGSASLTGSSNLA